MKNKTAQDDQSSFIHLNHFTLIDITGPDARAFLQGQFTCDINCLNPSSAILTACCNHQGRMLANFWIWPKENGYQLLLPSDMSALLLTHLSKYGAFSKVNLKENKDACFIYVALGAGLNKSHENTSRPTGIALTHLNQAELIISDHPHMTEDSNRNEWESLLIKQGITLIHPATTARFTPQMINLQLLGGVSFKKGCYVGQEVIARTEHLGKLKRHLYRFYLSDNTQPKIGDELYHQEQVMGMIMAIAEKGKKEYHVLAVIEDRAIHENLYLQGNHQKIGETVRVGVVE